MRTIKECPVKVEEHLGLIKSVVRKFHKGPDIEDSELYSVGCIALVEAARTFDPSRSKFSTWATRLVRQKVLDEVRHSKKQTPVFRDDLCEFESPETERLPVELASSFCSADPDEDASDRKSRLMLIGHCMEGKTLSELGREFGVSKECVRKRVLLAAEKIRIKNRTVWGDLG